MSVTLLPRSAAASLTSFLSVIQLPDLAHACISALDTEGEPGSGLKILRQLNQAINFMMLSSVQGYRLDVDGAKAQELLACFTTKFPRPKSTELPHFLKQTKLTRLHVLITGGR